MRPTLIWCLVLSTAAITAPAIAEPLLGVHDDWIRVRTETFIIYSEVPPRRTVNMALNLERLTSALEETSALSSRGDDPATVFFFADSESYAAFDRPGADRPGHSSAGLFRRSQLGNLLLIDLSAPNAESTLYHELLHDFVDRNLPYAPLWLNEGLAGFYETFEAGRSKATIGRPERWRVQILREREMLPLTDVLAMHERSSTYLGGEDRATFYAQSWALTHYLLSGSDANRSQFSTLLGLLGQGRSSADAIRIAYGLTLDALHAALETYLERANYRYDEFFFSGAIHAGRTRTTSATTATMCREIGRVVAARDGWEVAAPYFERAHDLAPDDPETLQTLAYLAFVQGDHAATERHARAAITEDDELVLAHVLLGEVLLARGWTRAAQIEAPPEMAEARSLFERCLELDASNTRCADGITRSHALDPMPGTAESPAPKPRQVPAVKRSREEDQAALDEGIRVARGLAETDQVRARAVLDSVIAEIYHDDLVYYAKRARSAIAPTSGKRSYEEVYNQAVLSANEEDFARARDLFLEAASLSIGGSSRMAARKARQMEHRLAYDRAHAALMAGEYEDSIAELEALLTEELAPWMQEAATELLQYVQDYLKVHRRQSRPGDD